VAGTVPLIGAGVSWSGASAGWWTDHPSAGLAAGMRQSRVSEPPLDWWQGLAKRQAAVGDDRAGRSLRPTRKRSQATGREPGRPAPPVGRMSEWQARHSGHMLVCTPIKRVRCLRPEHIPGTSTSVAASMPRCSHSSKDKPLRGAPRASLTKAVRGSAPAWALGTEGCLRRARTKGWDANGKEAAGRSVGYHPRG
jgi:hypothetical protein